MARPLSDDEVASLGLDAPAAAPRQLSDEEVASLGLDSAVHPEHQAHQKDDPSLVKNEALSSPGHDVYEKTEPGTWWGGIKQQMSDQAGEVNAWAERAGLAKPLEEGTRGMPGLQRLRAVLQGVTLGHAGEFSGDEATYSKAAKAEPVATVAGSLLIPLPGIGKLKALGKLAPLGRIAANAAMGSGMMLASGDTGMDPLDRLRSGALAGGAGGALGELALAAPKALRALGIKQGRGVLTGGSEPLTIRKAIPEGVVEEAVNSGIIRPFGTVAGAAGRAGAARAEAGGNVGRVLDELTARGVKPPDATQTAVDLLGKADAMVQTGNPKVGIYRQVAEELANEPSAKTGTLQGWEDIKRTLQANAAKEYDKVNKQMTPRGDALMEVAGHVKQAIEDAVDQQKHLAPDAAAAFIPAKERAGRLIQADDLLDRGAAKAASRKTFGLMPVLEALGASSLIGSGHGAGAGAGAGALTLLGSKLVSSVGPSTAAVAGLKGAKLASPLARLAAPKAGQGATALRAAAARMGQTPE